MPRPSDIKIIRHVTAHTSIIPCYRCRGIGRKPESAIRTVTWRREPTGRYRILDWSNKPCDVCKGEGVVRVFTPDILLPCAICGMTGSKLVYWNSFGSKYINDYENWFFRRLFALLRRGGYTKYSMYHPCEECNGLGVTGIHEKAEIVTPGDRNGKR